MADRNTTDLEFLRRRIAELEKDRVSLSSEEHETTTGSASGGGGGIDARVAKIEAAVEHVQKDISEIKGDIRELRTSAQIDFRILFGAIIAACLGLAGLMAHGFKWL